jgi:hypothetical protein
MTERMYKKYVAFDGTKFKTAEECIKYESERKEIELLLKAARRIRDICAKHEKKCDDCPFLIDETCPFSGMPTEIFQFL